MKKVLSLTLVALICSAALGAQTTWTGATSTAWGTASNWSTNAVPTASDNVVIAAASNVPVLPTTAVCNNITIDSGATLNGAAGSTLSVSGSWTNNGTFIPSTSTVVFNSAVAATIGGSSSTSFWTLRLAKSVKANTVTLAASVNVNNTTTSTSAPALDVQVGTLVTAGNNLTVVGATSGSTGNQNEIQVTVGGVVNFAAVYQNSGPGIANLTISAGTTTISGTHTIYNSGARCDISGGNVNYTTTGTAVNLSSNNTNWGWRATGGNISLAGSVTSGIFGSTFAATGTAIIRFVGSTNSTVNMLNTTSSGACDFRFNECRVEKTGGASVTINTGSTGVLTSNVTITLGLTVNAGAVATFTGNFSTGLGYQIASITNNGTLNLNAPGTQVLYTVPGNIITGTGATLNSGTNARVSLTTAAAATLSGTNNFNELYCTVPGRTVNFGAGTTTTITGVMNFVGASGNPILIRSTSTGTQANLQVNGAVVAQYCDVQDNAASSTVYATPGGTDSGNNVNWVFGGAVVAVATTGASQAMWSNSATQSVSGTFTLQNTTASAATLNSITVQASGTGNDSTAYTEVALYMDNPGAGTVGSFDGADALYGAAVAAFPADNGQLTFTASQALAAGSTTRFFAVVRFNGTPLASPGHTFFISVTALNLTGAPGTGMPSQAMPGFTMSQPSLVVAIPSVTARPVTSYYTGPGNDGFEYVRFTITNNSPVPVTMNNIRLYGYSSTSSYLGNITSVELFEDTNQSGAWERTGDTQVGSAFTTWTSFRDFTYTAPAGNFAGNEVRQYLVVVKLNGGTVPPNGAQLGFYVSNASTATGATITGSLQAVYYGVQIQGASLHTLASQGTAISLPGTYATGKQAGTFTVRNTSTGTSVTLNSITLQASGSGNDITGYSLVALYRDTNASGIYDAGDTLYGTAATNFATDNGTRVFTAAVAIAGGAIERFFVVVALNGTTTPTAGQTFKTRVSAISSTVTSDSLGLASAIMEGVVCTGTNPTLVATPMTLNLGSTLVGNPSSPVSYQLEGFNTTNATDITAPTGVEVSFSSGSGYASSLNIATTGNWGPTTVYARIANTASVGSISGNITNVSTGANSVNVAVNGTVTPAGIATSVSNLNLGTTTVGNPGTAFSYTVSGTGTVNLTDVTAPAGVHVSFSQTTGFGGAVQITNTGTWGPITIWARLTGASVGAVSGNITHISTGATSANVSVSGTVVQPAVTTSVANINLGSTPLGTAGTAVSYTVSGSNTTNVTDLTPPTGVEISFSQTTGFAGALQIASTGNWGPTTIWARMTGASAGAVSGNITHVSTGATSANVAVSGTVTPPTLSVSTPTLNLGSTPLSTPGTAVSYTVSGSGMTNDTDLTAPTGVEISFSQTTGFSGSLNIATTGVWGPTTIWARLTGSATGVFSGNITHVSTGATTVNVAISGNTWSLTANPTTLNLGTTVVGTPGTPQSYTLTGEGLTSATTVTAPAGIEVSLTAGSGYSGSLNINQTPSLSATVFVRLIGTTLGSYGGNVTNVSGPASANVAVSGDVVTPDNLDASRNGPSSSTTVDNDAQGAGGNGLVILDITVATTNTAWTVTDFVFSASGSADEQTALSFLSLYEDSTTGGTQGTFDGPATDTLATAAAGVSFTSANGTYTATLVNGAWAASTSRRFFLVAKLAGTAQAGETIQAELTTINATTGGTGTITGVPTTSGAPALTIAAAVLTATLNGPLAFTTVDNTSQGAGGNGHVVADVSLDTINDSWTVSSLTFTESGTMDGQTDLNFLALYLDNGNGTWDGPTTDTLATAAAGTSFNAANGTYTATLTAGASTFTVNQGKRFFLVARLSGQASPGETLRVELTSITESSPTAGTVAGTPTAATSALVIDVATLTVNGGPANPAMQTVEQTAAAFQRMIGQFRFTASNDNFVVTGITLTLGGNGDWVNNLNATSGVELYRDDGSGSFDVADTLVFSGPGGLGTVVATFTANQTVNMGTSMDLWLVLNVLATAGGSPAEVFNAQIANAAAVATATSGNVLIGTVPPASADLRVVTFSVTAFTPLLALPAGGGPITITGTGFALPCTLTIGGVPCLGTASVNAGGTQITGFTVPSGSGTNLPIVLNTNNLGPKTLTQTFSYSTVTTGGSGGGGGGGGGCVAGLPVAPLALLAPAILALAGLRRRRQG